MTAPQTALIERCLSRAEFEDNGGCAERQLEDVGALLREVVAALRTAERERDEARVRVDETEKALQVALWKPDDGETSAAVDRAMAAFYSRSAELKDGKPFISADTRARAEALERENERLREALKLCADRLETARQELLVLYADNDTLDDAQNVAADDADQEAVRRACQALEAK